MLVREFWSTPAVDKVTEHSAQGVTSKLVKSCHAVAYLHHQGIDHTSAIALLSGFNISDPVAVYLICA